MKKKIYDFISLMKMLLSLLSNRQKKIGIAIIMFVMVNACLQTASVFVVAPIVNAMTSPDDFMTSDFVIIMNRLFDIEGMPYVNLFALTCSLAVVLYFLKDVFSVFQVWLSALYSFSIKKKMSVEAMRSYMHHQYIFFSNYSTSEVIRDVQDDVNVVSSIINNLLYVMAEALTALFIIICILISDLKVAVCITVLTIVCLVLMYKIVKPKLKKSGEMYHVSVADNRKVLLQSIEGIKEVMVMNKQNFFINEYKTTLEQTKSPQVMLAVISSLPSYVLELVFFSGLILYLGTRVFFDPSYAKNISMLATLAMAAFRLLPSLGRISSHISNIIFAFPSIQKISTVTNQLRQYEEQYQGSLVTGKEETASFNRKIEFENVSWSYGHEKKILDGVSITIEKNDYIGIVGESGAGKSTFVDVLLGLYCPQKGVVRVDGKDIGKVLTSYRAMIGYVPQFAYLMDATIKENVAFGIDRNSIDDEKVWEALKKAQMDTFVMELKNGLDTEIGERGIKFSGGQVQRLAIARALYNNPSILVLDEATSALDIETEKKLMDVINGLAGSITVIVITHRLSTIELCNKVYMIKEGRMGIRD